MVCVYPYNRAVTYSSVCVCLCMRVHVCVHMCVYMRICLFYTSWKQNDAVTGTMATRSWVQIALSKCLQLPCCPQTWPTRYTPSARGGYFLVSLDGVREARLLSHELLALPEARILRK